jgi:ATP-dependent Lon protease
MVIPLFVGREKSIKALEQAMAVNKQILLLAQKNASHDDPGLEDLYAVGTISTVLQLLRLPDGTVKVLVEGGARTRIKDVRFDGSCFRAGSELIEETFLPQKEGELLVQTVMKQFEQYANLSKKVPGEVMGSLSGIDDPGRLADTIAAHMPLALPQKQEVLEMADIKQRLEHLLGLMEAEIDLFQVEKRIRGRVKKTDGTQSAGILSE